MQEFARLIQNTFRESDVFARIEENQFAIFLAGSSEKVAHIAVKRLVNAVRTHNIKSNRAYPLSFSYAVASNRSGTENDLEQLLSDAQSKLG